MRFIRPILALLVTAAIPTLAVIGLGSGSSSSRHGDPSSPQSYLRAARLAPALTTLRRTLGPRAEVFDLAAYPNAVVAKTADASGAPRLYTVDSAGRVHSYGLAHATLAQEPADRFRLSVLAATTPQVLISRAGRGFGKVNDVQATAEADGKVNWDVDFTDGSVPYEADLRGHPTSMTALDAADMSPAVLRRQATVARARGAAIKARVSNTVVKALAPTLGVTRARREVACVQRAGADVQAATACTANP